MIYSVNKSRLKLFLKIMHRRPLKVNEFVKRQQWVKNQTEQVRRWGKKNLLLFFLILESCSMKPTR